MVVAESPTPIPAEWRDPRHVMPHLTHELREWHLQLKALGHDLAVIQGALDPDGEEIEGKQVLEWVTATRARLEDLAHDVGSRLQAFVLISDDLKRNGGTPNDG